MCRLCLPLIALLTLASMADACGNAGSRLGKFRARRSAQTQTVSYRATTMIRATASVPVAPMVVASGCDKCPTK
jgi:hypothetical protein